MTDAPIDDKTNAAADAIEDAIRKSTLGIVTGSGSQKWRGIGTGTLVRYEGSLLIVTADHVVGDTASDDLRFFLPNQTPPAAIDRETLLKLHWLPARGLRSFSELNIVRISRDKELDLAAIQVADGAVLRDSVAAFDLSGDFEPPPGETSLALGFPHDISRALEDDSRVVFSQFDWAPVEEARTDLEHFDPAIHFLVKYTPPQSYPDANPRGFSGSARWARRSSTPDIWHPNVEIAGVTVTYYPRHQLLKMVGRSALNGFLDRIAGG